MVSFNINLPEKVALANFHGLYLAIPRIDSQDTLSFSVLTGVRSMNEVFPIERAAEAYELMMNGKVRFRAVLTTGH